MTELRLINLLKPLNVLVYIDESYDRVRVIKRNRLNSDGSYINSLASSFDSSIDADHPIHSDHLIDTGHPVDTNHPNDPMDAWARDRSDSNISTDSLSSEYQDRLFSALQTFLTYFLNQKFTIYATSLQELNRRAWLSTTKLLIVLQNDLDESTYLEQPRNQVIKEFQSQTNSVIILNRSLITSGDLQNLNFEALKSKIQQKLGNEIVCEHPPELTTHYVYSEDLNQSNQLLSYLDKELHLKAKLCKKQDDMSVKFDAKLYLQSLGPDNKLGRHLIAVDVTKSTQPIVEGAPFTDGLVAIANQQTTGKGRGKNQWLSPEGSICFTYEISFPPSSILFKQPAFFPHLNALAVLFAIKALPNAEKLDLKIKWPNDIYHESQHKLVGILTNSQFEDGRAKFIVGIGVNFSNCQPAYSLKSIIEKEGKKFVGCKEQLIAEILNRINDLIQLINQDKQKVVELYYANWLLADKFIQLDTGKQAHVLSLDEDGYLQVRLLENNEIISLLPNANQFDIMEQMTIDH